MASNFAQIVLTWLCENAAGSEEFLAEFNKAMTKTVLRSAGRYHGYYEKDARRVIELTWLDPENKILRLQDELRCDVIVFSQQTEIYEIKCTATAGLGIDSYKLSVTASVNNVTAKPSGDSADGRSIFRLEVPHTTNPNKFHRAIAAETGASHRPDLLCDLRSCHMGHEYNSS
jgi:hypothetical protein